MYPVFYCQRTKAKESLIIIWVKKNKHLTFKKNKIKLNSALKYYTLYIAQEGCSGCIEFFWRLEMITVDIVMYLIPLITRKEKTSVYKENISNNPLIWEFSTAVQISKRIKKQ